MRRNLTAVRSNTHWNVEFERLERRIGRRKAIVAVYVFLQPPRSYHRSPAVTMIWIIQGIPGAVAELSLAAMAIPSRLHPHPVPLPSRQLDGGPTTLVNGANWDQLAWPVPWRYNAQILGRLIPQQPV